MLTIGLSKILKTSVFKCLKSGQRTVDCQNRNYFKSNQKHHSSLCVSKTNCRKTQEIEIRFKRKDVGFFWEIEDCYPIIIIEANGTLCRALVDAGVGSSYDSAILSSCIGTIPVRWEKRQIEKLLYTTSKKVEMYYPTISKTVSLFHQNWYMQKVKRQRILTVPNLENRTLIQS